MTLAKSRLSAGGYDTLLIAVTVLTSMADSDLLELGISGNAQEHVLRLATLTKNAGLDGVVCSAQEASVLKSALGSDFKLVTPGIRLATDSSDDQQRICTPKDALANGSDYLVVGRSITNADNPNDKLRLILNNL